MGIVVKCNALFGDAIKVLENAERNKFKEEEKVYNVLVSVIERKNS